MKRIFFPLFLCLAIACSRTYKAAKSRTYNTITVGALTLPATPHAGDRVRIQYRMDSLEMADIKHLEITLYHTVGDKIYAELLPLPDAGNPLNITFTLPDSAQAFALRFHPPQTSFRKIRYVFPVYDQAGEPVAGARAGTGLFYRNEGSELLGLSADEDTALQRMRADFTAHTEIRHRWMDTYLNTLLVAKKDSAYPEIQTTLQQMRASDSMQQEDYATAYHLYIQMNMWEQADSVMNAGARMFPEGSMAMQLAVASGRRQMPVDSMIARYRRFKQRFPDTGRQSVAVKMQDEMLRPIVARYSEKGDYPVFMTFISQISNPLQRAESLSFLAKRLAAADKALPFADSISRMSLDLVRRSIDHPEQGKQNYQTGNDWRRDLQEIYAGYADGYALLLRKEGKAKDAVAYQRRAVDYSDGRNRLKNERYMHYLIEAKDYTAAQKQLEAFIANGKTSDKLDAYLKPVYVYLNHSEEGFGDYRHQLEAKAEAQLMANLAEELPQQTVDEPAIDFTLPDLKGEQVGLAALKGKVVVLDFWATWCVPCKASFPGMQKVVDHFRNDSNVVFLFIDTGEESLPEQRHREVSGFIAGHNYPFHVLLDQRKATDSTKYQVYNDYKTNGIPLKVIIDPRGHIRFRKLGFFGSTPAEVKEVTQMIEMAGG